MANDLFGGLGGLMKGLSGFMPQDDPSVKLMNAQNEMNELKDQENELYAELGRKLVSEQGIDAFPSIASRLKLVQMNIAAAEEKLTAVNQEKASADAEKQARDAATLCPSCGTRNPDGIKFCQECGAKLGAPEKAFCQECGAENTTGARFCGSCGARQGD